MEGPMQINGFLKAKVNSAVFIYKKWFCFVIQNAAAVKLREYLLINPLHNFDGARGGNGISSSLIMSQNKIRHALPNKTISKSV